ncbi:MAG TPA: alpha/beta fold hydrolase [Actinomycetes bacterium]|nr:alpha/beta fold hydrolase [Actinomycetes bacterium]
MLMSAASTPEGPGSASGAQHLPAGFTDTFTSRYVDTGELRLHAVTGGDGPPLLLVHGWPQTWYAWRMLMPALARDFQVVAVDQRGIGLSDKPQDGYDTGTLARDLVALMDALGHQRFALYGTDTGMPIAYALAADHPDRLERLADLPTEQTAVMAATQRPIAASAFTDVSGPPGWKRLPSWAVVATGDKAAGSDVVRSMAQRAGADIVEVEGSHVIMVSQPQAVTNLVLKAVNAAGG